VFLAILSAEQGKPNAILHQIRQFLQITPGSPYPKKRFQLHYPIMPVLAWKVNEPGRAFHAVATAEQDYDLPPAK
jgi:hypothetical protein